MTAAAVLLFVSNVFAAPAPAARPEAFTVDARIELLGVLQELAGVRPDLPVDPEYHKAVLGRFARYRKHAAVTLYKELAAAPGGEGLAIALLWCTAPPELALRGLSSSPPYFGSEGQSLAQALTALRSFAKASRFSQFYASRRDDYARAVVAAREALGVDDPLSRVESYLGLSLQSRASWLVSPLYVPMTRGAFIVPYPDPASLTDPGPAPFEVYTVVAYAPGARSMGANVTQLHRSALWQEPLFVFIDPALAAFDAELGIPSEAFYGPEVASCRRQNTDCVKSWLVGALAARLDIAAFGAPSMGFDGSDLRREKWILALSERLKEYESDRKRWPTLWDFLPRLLAVFPEAVGLKPSAVRPHPRVAKVKELFPGWREP